MKKILGLITLLLITSIAYAGGKQLKDFNALSLEVEMEEIFRSVIHNGKNDEGVHFYRVK